MTSWIPQRLFEPANVCLVCPVPACTTMVTSAKAYMEHAKKWHLTDSEASQEKLWKLLDHAFRRGEDVRRGASVTSSSSGQTFRAIVVSSKSDPCHPHLIDGERIYGFRWQRKMSGCDRYICYECYKQKKNVQIKVVNNRFLSDPTELPHVCSTKAVRNRGHQTEEQKEQIPVEHDQVPTKKMIADQEELVKVFLEYSKTATQYQTQEAAILLNVTPADIENYQKNQGAMNKSQK